MMNRRHTFQLSERYIGWLVVTILVTLLVSCGGGTGSSLSLPKGSSGDEVPLYSGGQQIAVEDADLSDLIGDLLGTESLRYSTSTSIAWTEDTGAKVQDELDGLLPDANYRLESDWSGSGQFRASRWRNGDVQLVVMYMDNLDSSQISDLNRHYGISELLPGSTLIITHAWDTMQPLPTFTPTATSTSTTTPTPTATPLPTFTPTATSTPTATHTPTVTPTPTPTPLPGTILIEDNFDDGDADGWLPTEGSWNVVNGEYICAGQENRTFIGEEFWSDYVVRAEIRPLAGRIDIGVIGRVQDSEHFYLAQLIDNKATLFRRNGGRWEKLAEAPYALQLNQTYRLELELRGLTISSYVNGVLVASVEDATYLSGYAGLRCAAGAQAIFDNFTVATLSDR